MGVLGTTTAFADDTPAGTTPADANKTVADLETNNQNSATTNGSITFGAGTLSLYNVPDTATFDGKLGVGNVYLDGVDATASLTATVADFLGAADDNWTLNLSQSGWKAGVGGSEATASRLNTGTLSVTPDSGSAVTLSNDKSDAVYATGSAGVITLPSKLNFHMDPGASVQAGNYTNTLNWKLTDPAAPTQK